MKIKYVVFKLYNINKYFTIQIVVKRCFEKCVHYPHTIIHGKIKSDISSSFHIILLSNCSNLPLLSPVVHSHSSQFFLAKYINHFIIFDCYFFFDISQSYKRSLQFLPVIIFIAVSGPRIFRWPVFCTAIANLFQLVIIQLEDESHFKVSVSN